MTQAGVNAMVNTKKAQEAIRRNIQPVLFQNKRLIEEMAERVSGNLNEKEARVFTAKEAEYVFNQNQNLKKIFDNSEEKSIFLGYSYNEVKEYLKTPEGMYILQKSIERILFQNPQFFKEIVEMTMAQQKETGVLEIDKKKSNDEWECKIAKILGELEAPHALLGYKYAIYAILLVMEDPEMISNMTKVVYPKVAKKFNSTPSRAERAIRHFIERIFSKSYNENTEKYFGYTVSLKKGKPTNSEFIATIADFILMEEKSRL